MDSMTNGTEALVIPAAVRGEGKLGSFFVTDIWIKAAATGSATLEYHAADSPTSPATATTTVALAQPVVYIADFLRSSFGLASGFGVLRVRANISTTVRVYNQTGAGAHGLAFMGMPARMGMSAMPMSGSYGVNAFAVYMLGLLPEPGNRVNVMVVAPNDSGATGVVEILDADGGAPSGTAPTSYPFTLAGFSSHQLNDILAGLHSRFGNGDAGLEVRVRMNQRTTGMAMAYAVVNDNATNDGYVAMRTMINAGQGREADRSSVDSSASPAPNVALICGA